MSAPEPAAIATTTRSACFDNLPLELLKYIIDLVHEQDKGFNPRQIKRATIAPPREGQADESEANIREGRWSASYGRGVLALSLVRTRLRTLALPYVFKTVTPYQLNKPFFRYHLLHRDTIRYMKHLDLNHSNHKENFDSAYLLRHLPSLCEITVGDDIAEMLWGDRDVCQPLSTEDVAYVRQIFLEYKSKWSRINLAAQPDPSVHFLAHYAAPSSAKSLSFSTDISPLNWEDAGLRKHLLAFGLSDLSLAYVHDAWGQEDSEDDDDDDIADPEWLEQDACIPSLLKLEMFGLRNPAQALEVAQRLSPSLESLSLRQVEAVSSEQQLLKVSFPHLRHLTLEGNITIVSLISAFKASPLTTLNLSSFYETTQRCSRLLPSPSTLRHLFSDLRVLHVDLYVLVPPRDVERYRAACAESGISLSLRCSLIETVDQDEEAHRLTRAALEDAQWATRHVRQLVAANDEVGLEEMARALQSNEVRSSPEVSLVKHLDLSETRLDTSAAAATSLPNLSSLSPLTIDYLLDGDLGSYVPDGHPRDTEEEDEEVALRRSRAREVLKASASKWTSLRFNRCPNLHELMEDIVESWALRRLKISSASNPFMQDAHLPALLPAMQLEELEFELDVDDYIFVHSVWVEDCWLEEGVVLPTLRKLTLPTFCGTGSHLPFIRQFAPALTTLSLTDLCPSWDAGDPDDTTFRGIRFPELRHTSLKGDPDVVCEILPHFRLCRIEHLGLISTSSTSGPCKATFPLAEILETTPHLRTLFINLYASACPADIESYRKRCFGRGITFTSQWSPDFGVFEPILSPAPSAQGSDEEEDVYHDGSSSAPASVEPSTILRLRGAEGSGGGRVRVGSRSV
ncbi:hypothetical protein JCM11641_006788 [Rhodosporidiobolus odoratus]